MTVKFTKGFLFVVFCLVILKNKVNPSDEELDNVTKSLVSRVFNKCLRDDGRKSHKQLIALKTEYLDTESSTFQKLIETQSLPSKVDLSRSFTPPPDQDELGSCTANALVTVMLYAQSMRGQESINNLSWLYIYWQARYLEDTISKDVGASISDGILALLTKGVCREYLWRYEAGNMAKKPTKIADIDAIKHKLDPNEINAVAPNLMVMKLLLKLDTPIIGGIVLYESFMSTEVAKYGLVPMPNTRTEQYLGGHAVVFVGYDDSKKAFLVRNSWGTRWGQKGYFWLPYAYTTNPNLAFNFWKITKISGLTPIKDEKKVTKNNDTLSSSCWSSFIKMCK